MRRKLQWPLKRCILLTLVLEGGHVIHQQVSEWKVSKLNGDIATDIAYHWAGERNKYRLVRADKLMAMATMPGPLYWRGWFA